MKSIILCAFLFIVISTLLYCCRIHRQKRKKKVVGKAMNIFIISVLLIGCVYSAMLLDTHPLVKEVKSALKGEIPAKITENAPMSRYNIRDRGYGARTEKTNIGEAWVSLIRYFTIHNFRDGYIWAIYSNQAYDSNGNPFDGSYRIPTKWKIHKTDEKWEIVEIFEAP